MLGPEKKVNSCCAISMHVRFKNTVNKQNIPTNGARQNFVMPVMFEKPETSTR